MTDTPKVKTAVKAVMQADANADLPPEVQNDIEIARVAQQRLRAEAPDAIMNAPNEVPQKRLMKQFAPEAVGPDATHHAMFGDKDLYKQYLTEGYEPKYNKGQPIAYGKDGDPLMVIPKDIHDARTQAEAARGNRILSGKWDADNEEDIKKGALARPPKE
jgi:hypothetical protein